MNATRHIVVQVRIGGVRAAAGAGHRNGALFVQHFVDGLQFLRVSKGGVSVVLTHDDVAKRKKEETARDEIPKYT